MKILFITRRSEKCGVADYGKRLFSILQPAMDITMQELDGPDQINYSGYDIALYNYHHATLPFVNCDNKSIKHVALFHEAFQNIAPDTWIPVSELVRPIFKIDEDKRIVKFENSLWRKNIPVIGSFGFGFPDKNYVGIAKMVKREFDQAILRLHIPFAEFGDETGDMALARVYECRDELADSNIELQVECRFMSQPDLIKWLADNDLNVFNCIPTQGRGISSSIDYALSAGQPIGVSSSEMYRHLPREICIDNISLPRLIAHGAEPLKKVYEENSNERLIEQMKEWLTK